MYSCPPSFICPASRARGRSRTREPARSTSGRVSGAPRSCGPPRLTPEDLSQLVLGRLQSPPVPSGKVLAAAVDEEVHRALGATTAQNGLPEAPGDLLGRAREDAGRQIHGVGSFCDVANPLRSFACVRGGLFPGHDFSLTLATTTRRAWAALRREPDRPGLIEATAH